jgi:hypothetical protein
MVATPLEFRPLETWDPAEDYWGEPGEPVPAALEPVIAAGPRPLFEMQQVIPGEDFDDPFDDPILRAVDARNSGDLRGARRLLHELLKQDVRCIDAHAHLGNFALDEDPPRALDHYGRGVAVAELSFPPGFDGVLSWGLVDNRPFLRCLHGYALALWRLRRFDAAAQVLDSMLWLNPADNQGASALLEEVRAHRPWTA